MSSKNSAWESRLAAASCKRTSRVWSRPERRSCLSVVSRGFMVRGSFWVEGCGSKTIRDTVLVGVEAADQWVGFQKVQLGRWPGLFQQGAQVAQPPRAMMQGFLRRAFQRLDRMFLGQRQQAVQDPCTDGTALLDHRLGPTAGVRTDQPGAIQQVIQAVLDDVAVRGLQMVGIGGELSRFGQRMNGDDFPPLIEDAHQPGLPSRPDLATDILRGHRVIRPLQLDVAVPMHPARRFLERRKQTRWQRQQFWAFQGAEDLADLLPGGAVDAGVGHAAFPIGEKKVLGGQTLEAAALERV